MFLGTACAVPAPWLFLAEMDDVCVFNLELYRRDEHKEGKPEGLFSQEAFWAHPSSLGSPVWLWSSGVEGWHRIRQRMSVPSLQPGE